MATRRTYEFGEFQLDPAQRRIERRGEIVTLHAKAFDALVYLVEHAGEPVSRRALTEALWPKRVVEENNLTQAISALRRALGDECIVTLAGRGYQFVSEVRTVEVDPNADVVMTSEHLNSDGGPPAVTAPAIGPASVAATRPVRVRRVLVVGASFAVAAILGLWAYFSPSRESVKVLVLPFETLSQDSEQQEFADGLTDELISGLRTLSGLRVIGPTTSFAMRGRSAPDAAAELGVQYVLEGSIDRDGGEWRISAQLSDAAGFSVWPFDRSDDSILDAHDAMLEGIAEALGVSVSVDEAPQRGTDDPAAYHLYLASLAAARSIDTEPALDRINRALDRDKDFAAAWSMKAGLLTLISSNLPADEGRAHLRLAQEAADKAISLAPNDGMAHHARAFVLGVQGDWFGAERAYEEALEPGDSDTSWQPVTWPLFLLSVGRVARARETFERMFDSDRLNESLLGFLMLSQELSGRPKAADDLDELRRLLDAAGSFGRSVSTFIRLGREGESVSVEDVRPLDRQFAQPGLNPDERLARLRLAAKQPEYASPVAQGNLAAWAASFNEKKLALGLLEQAVTEQALLWYLAWLPVFDDVRQTPEFKDLLEKVGLVEYWRATGWPDVCRPVGQSDFACD